MSILLCDFPWEYRNSGVQGSLIDRQGREKYASMSVSEIIEQTRIPSTALIMLCWATMPLVCDAVTVMQHLGFAYRGWYCVWFKTTVHGKRAFGMGKYTASNIEVVMLGTRGAIPKPMPFEMRALARSHSQKPDEFKEIVLKKYPGERPLEYHARDTTDKRLDYEPSQEAELYSGLTGDALRERINSVQKTRQINKKRRKVSSNAYHVQIPPYALPMPDIQLNTNKTYDVALMRFQTLEQFVVFPLDQLLPGDDAIVLIRANDMTYHLYVCAARQADWVYTTAMFYVSVDEVYLVARKKSTKFTNLKVRQLSQIVDAATMTVEQQLRKVIRADKSICCVEMVHGKCTIRDI